MASSSCPVVLGKQYCYDHEVKLEMKEEWWVACGGFVIKDVLGKEYFQVHQNLKFFRVFRIGSQIDDVGFCRFPTSD